MNTIIRFLFTIFTLASGGRMAASSAPQQDVKTVQESIQSRENSSQLLARLGLAVTVEKRVSQRSIVTFKLKNKFGIMCAYLSGNCANTADAHNTPRGYVHVLEVTNVYFRKKGLARILFSLFNDMCFDAGSKKIVWLAASIGGNTISSDALVAFYTKLGGRIISHAPEGVRMECDVVPKSIKIEALQDSKVAQGCCK